MEAHNGVARLGRKLIHTAETFLGQIMLHSAVGRSKTGVTSPTGEHLFKAGAGGEVSRTCFLNDGVELRELRIRSQELCHHDAFLDAQGILGDVVTARVQSGSGEEHGCRNGKSPYIFQDFHRIILFLGLLAH